MFGGGPLAFQARIKSTSSTASWKNNGVVPNTKNAKLPVLSAMQFGTLLYSVSEDAAYKSNSKAGSFIVKH